MEVYRLSQAKHGKTLSGKGASLAGGRWNSLGTEMIYTAANRSLAMAEVAVHFSLATLPNGYMMMKIHIPDNIPYVQMDVENLPKDWNVFPPVKATQRIGDVFIQEAKDCLMKVPSAVTQGDFNFLINPLHQEFKKIRIVTYVPFTFDKRLFKS